MKKNSLYLILFFTVFVTRSFAQEVAIDDASAATVLNDYELTDKQYSAWKSILNNWLVSDYEKIEMENNIKLNCKSCESFYMEVIIKVSANGKMEYYKVLNGKNCKIAITKQLELRIMRMFFKFDFPPVLRNTTFKTRLGNVLKC